MSVFKSLFLITPDDLLAEFASSFVQCLCLWKNKISRSLATCCIDFMQEAWCRRTRNSLVRHEHGAKTEKQHLKTCRCDDICAHKTNSSTSGQGPRPLQLTKIFRFIPQTKKIYDSRNTKQIKRTNGAVMLCSFQASFLWKTILCLSYCLAFCSCLQLEVYN